MSPERRHVILALAAAFVFGVSGGIVGTLGTIAVLHHVGPFGAFGRPPGGPEPGLRRRGGPGEPRGPRAERAPMERLLVRQLDLSDAQRERIERILDDARPRYAAVRESTRAEIARVLTPEQRERMQQIESRFPARRRGDRAAP